MGTVDANVWVAGFDTTDVFHAESIRLMHEVARRGMLLFSPSFVLVEVACVVARRFRDSSAGARAAADIASNGLVRLLPLDDVLLSLAADLGTQRFLRGADALYAATAQLTGSAIITRDQELIRRAGAVSPSDWLASLG
jgi:predicted nucleic acid-binding protein